MRILLLLLVGVSLLLPVGVVALDREDRALVREIEAAGCSGVEYAYEPRPGGSWLSVSVAMCRSADGRLSPPAAVAMIMQTAWEKRGYAVKGIAVRQRGGGGARPPDPLVRPEAALAKAYGQIADLPAPRTSDSARLAIAALPVLVALVASLVLLFLRAAWRHGAAVVLLTRR